MNPILHPSVLLLALASSACGGSVTPPDGSTGTDGAASDDGSASDAGALDPQPRQGVVSLSAVTSQSTPSAAARISAYFEDDTASNATTVCGSRTVGQCRFLACEHDRTGSPPLVSAGTLTVTGGTGGPVMGSPDETNVYTFPFPTPATYAVGDTLQVAAAGATVPAFSADLHLPARLTSTTPANNAPTTTIQRSAGFTVSWTGGGTDEVRVEIEEHHFTDNLNRVIDRYLNCTYPAGDHAATIPPEALGLLVPEQYDYDPGALWNPYMNISSVNRQQPVAGNFPVAVEAFNHAANLSINIE